MTCLVARFGRRFGIASGCLAAFACSEAVFTSAEDPRDGETEIEPGAGGSAGKAGAVESSPDVEQDSLPVGGPSSSIIARGGSSSSSSDNAGAAGVGNDDLPVEAVGGEGNLPTCTAPVHDTWESKLNTGGNPWVVEFGDPFVDVANERLVVSYDDVASRSKPFVGSYYVSADVTLEGYTVLTPYPYVWEVILPSLRRNAAGTGIELGSTQYGSTEAWQKGPGGFSGVTIPNTRKVRVTSYIKASSKRFAVKVESAGNTYRSGWIGGFTWEKTNLGIFRFVGENNSAVYGSSNDYVYGGAVDGCEELSDSDVEQFYASGS
jgi:hypothetical protein